RAQRQALAITVDPMGCWIQCQCTYFYEVVGKLRRSPSQYGLNASHELLGRKRLGDIVVGAGLEAFNLIVLGPFGGQHDDRNLASTLVVTQLLGQGNARGAG